MKTKLPRNVLFHRDIQLLVYKAGGIFNQKQVKTIVDFLDREEARAHKPFNRFTDMSKVVAIDLDYSYVFQIALHRRLTYAARPVIKSAFYVTTEGAAEVVRIHAFVTDRSPIQVKMFTQIAEAAEWLGVSRETLELYIRRA